MDIKDMLNQLDSLYGNGNLKEAETHLSFWLEQALENNNYGAALTLYNEMEGLYRTTGRAKEAAEISDNALKLIEFMGLNGTVHHATTLLNGATANRWANNIDKALEMYTQAESIYNNLGTSNTYLFASLYNNISHIYQQKNQHQTALEYLQKALNLITPTEDSAPEIATTRVAMSLSYLALGKKDEAIKALQLAKTYYESENGQTDGHYGSYLSALGEYYWRCKDYDNAVSTYEKALSVIKSRFGENDGYKTIAYNLEIINNEKQRT